MPIYQLSSSPIFFPSAMISYAYPYHYHGRLFPSYPYSLQLVDAHDAVILENMLFLEQYGQPRPRSENFPANSRVSSYDQRFPANTRRFNYSEDETIVFTDASLSDEVSARFYHQEDETIILEDSLDHHHREVFNNNGGLSEAIVIRKMKTGVVGKLDENDAEVCVVCQDQFQENDEIGMLDNCKHICHQECMKKWLVRKNLCPVCKAVGLN